MTRTIIDDVTSAGNLANEGVLDPSESHGGASEKNLAGPHQVHALDGIGSSTFDWFDKAGPFAQVEF
jgi:hypothetical protein